MKWIAIPLVVVWICSTVYAFWYFQIRNLRLFDMRSESQQPFFDGEQYSLTVQAMLANYIGTDDKEQVTVFNFWDPTCPCSRFNESHVRDIMVTYMKQGIRFVIVPRYGNGMQKTELAQLARKRFGTHVEINYDYHLALRHAVPSSPAAAVMDAQGQLAYFGPYSIGSFCGPSGGAFVEKALNSLIRGKNPKHLNTFAFGCFCEWNNNSSQSAINLQVNAGVIVQGADL